MPEYQHIDTGGPDASPDGGLMKRLHPGHTDPTTVGEEWEENAFIRVWRGLDPEGTDPCTVWEREGLPSVGVLNAQGRSFMPPMDNPFIRVRPEVEQLRQHTPFIFVDMHAETTSEKVALGWYLDGQVAAIDLDPVKFESIVTLRMDSKVKDLPADTSAGIFTSGLLGESYIGLQPGGDPDVLKPGEEIVFTQPAVDLIQLVGKYMFSGGGAGGDAASSNESHDGAPAPAQSPRRSRPARSAAQTTGR